MTASENVRCDQEAYEAWKKDYVRFDPIGRGPLIIDHKTGMVYDAMEFWMRFIEEERKHTNPRTKP